jgi:hypothetical protein
LPSAKPQPIGTLFKVLDVPFGELGRHPDLARELCEGRYDVALIRGVFRRDTMDVALDRLVKGEHGITVSPQSNPDTSVPQVIVYGHSITPNDLDTGDPSQYRARYHDKAIEFRARCRVLFEGVEDYERRIGETFAAIGGGASVAVPQDPEGRLFTPSTIRRLAPKAEINLHVGNYFRTSDAYSFLGTLFSDLDQLSFFVPLSPPESGGEIEVFELTWGDPRTPLREGFVDAPVVERTVRFESYAPDKGDMFLFNGGRFYHRVDHVVGAHPRWTIGGFLAFSREGSTLYHWG